MVWKHGGECKTFQMVQSDSYLLVSTRNILWDRESQEGYEAKVADSNEDVSCYQLELTLSCCIHLDLNAHIETNPILLELIKKY